MSLDYAQVQNDPVPVVRASHEPNLAFVIHRNKNKNVVSYAANLLADGSINAADPLKVDWIMFENAGVPREGLNMVERNTAYGVNVSPMEGKPGHYKVVLASLPDKVIDFHLVDGKPVALMTINGKDGSRIDRVFVTSTTSWGMPKVQHIEIFGTDPSGAAIVEKKIP
ncbi:hypothetical protein SPRG_11860 [Saprolegnia parasitica CBS 223.65]|uniref:DUF4833 domain-containing protein n=1 Tax=Saprolegnia parasitica (strain CBS 223.65) TaxID=695850 RepID=A0A067BWU9_SAPPC|nr:hypothetical protein SPRG_11860 [Saprolegnia parasitica CBS 223.65]KDO23014.1 hypothetical protein SPRG_11860 [Saprolegnia parasitica CBS 223.65]|eukprot:XP_012206302.1 hypothetical protein SPRG_11860 [Saprolegnia parasitica CBS 223.65]